MTYAPLKELGNDCRAQKSAVDLSVFSSFPDVMQLISWQIDVHYSLPRDDHGRGADKEKNQV